MEEGLAREMARMKMEKEKQARIVEKICVESEELKQLQAKIKAAYLNKERASQVTENQFRKQVDLEHDALMEREMLRLKEIEERLAREKEEQRRRLSAQQKYNLQEQMAMKEQLRREAYEEYLKEKEQVDRVVTRMIEEDRNALEQIRAKQEQAKMDMIMSVQEKREMLRR